MNADRWKFREVAAGDWAMAPNAGLGSLFVPSKYIDAENFKNFFSDYNPTSLGEQNTTTNKKIMTVDGEEINVILFRPNDIHRSTKIDLKLEFQTEAVYDRLKFLYNNGKSFYLYDTDNLVITDAKRYYLMMDDLSIDRVAMKGRQRIYNLTLKCTDLDTDATGASIRWKFMEAPGRQSWVATITGAFTSSPKSFLTDHGPNSFNSGFKKKGVEIETINGKIVRVNPIRIRDDGQGIERIPSTKSMNMKLEYQTTQTMNNIMALYNGGEEFTLFNDSAGSDPDNALVKVAVIDDFTEEYAGSRGTEKLHHITIVIREISES